MLTREPCHIQAMPSIHGHGGSATARSEREREQKAPSRLFACSGSRHAGTIPRRTSDDELELDVSCFFFFLSFASAALAAFAAASLLSFTGFVLPILVGSALWSPYSRSIAPHATVATLIDHSLRNAANKTVGPGRVHEDGGTKGAPMRGGHPEIEGVLSLECHT